MARFGLHDDDDDMGSRRGSKRRSGSKRHSGSKRRSGSSSKRRKQFAQLRNILEYAAVKKKDTVGGGSKGKGKERATPGGDRRSGDRHSGSKGKGKQRATPSTTKGENIAKLIQELHLDDILIPSASAKPIASTSAKLPPLPAVKTITTTKPKHHLVLAVTTKPKSTSRHNSSSKKRKRPSHSSHHSSHHSSYHSPKRTPPPVLPPPRIDCKTDEVCDLFAKVDIDLPTPSVPTAFKFPPSLPPSVATAIKPSSSKKKDASEMFNLFAGVVVKGSAGGGSSGGPKSTKSKPIKSKSKSPSSTTTAAAPHTLTPPPPLPPVVVAAGPSSSSSPHRHHHLHTPSDSVHRIVPVFENERVRVFNIIHDAAQRLGPQTNACMADNGTLLKTFLKESDIGKGSGNKNGEVFKACYPITCDAQGKCTCNTLDDANSVLFSIKKIPLDMEVPLINPLVNDITSQRWTKYEVYAEVVATQLATFLVREHVCPNLPFFYAWYPCPKCTFKNNDVIQRCSRLKTEEEVQACKAAGKGDSNIPCIIAMNELANGGSLYDWTIKQKSLTAEDFRIMFFQVLMGLLALKRYYTMRHNDLHANNILVHNIKPGGLWEYIINDQSYYCPNTGFLMVIWDFGYAEIPREFNTDKNTGQRKNMYRWTHYDFGISDHDPDHYDYFRMGGYIMKKAKDRGYKDVYEEMRSAIKMDMSMEDLLVMLYHNAYFTTPPANRDSILGTYSLDKQIKIPPPYNKFLTHRMTVR